MLRDLCPGSCDGGQFVRGFEIGGLVFAAGSDAVVATDGTPDGTVRLSIGEPRSPSAAAGDLALILKGSFPGPWELLASDGTVAGTLPLTDFDPPIDGSSEPTGLVELGGEALFLAFRGEGGDRVDLMASRGRPGATRTVLAIPGGSGVLAGTRRAGDRVYFLQHPFSSGAELWITDGTAAGTVPLGGASFLADAPWGSLGEDLLAYRQGNGVHRLSGPPYQDTLLSNQPRPPHLERTQLPEEHFVPLGGRVLIPSPVHWWSTDGTPAGTVELAPPPGDSGVIQMSGWTPWGDELLYLDRYRGLWATDGFPGHTRRVCPALWDMEVALHLFAIDGGLIFSVAEPPFSADPVAGLWTSDGRSGCQRAVPGVSIESSGLVAGVAAVLGGRLFFSSDDGLHGQELWVSDGTAGGTRLLADLNPGPAESRPHRMRVVGGRLFFTANDGAHGYELWSTDGTREGTVRHGDVAPGPWSSHPDELTVVGDRLLFTADDGTRGRELWALPLSTPDCADPAVLCLRQDRFRVQVAWRDQRTGRVGAGTALPFSGSDRTGMFWFFDAANVELIVKLLEGGPVNGFQWVFYGGLSDVEYWVNVTDATTGTTRTYRNPPGTVCGLGDTAAFPVPAALASGPVLNAPAEQASPAPSAPSAAAPLPAPGGPGGCQPDEETLCLLGGRFEATVEWRDQRSGDSGVGSAIAGTDKSGFFWFFDPSNVELVVKALDGQSVNGRFWVFCGALSDVEYTIRVVDTQAGGEQTYHNPPGEICGQADTEAF
jgi:ELWxxDGT repeat protein